MTGSPFVSMPPAADADPPEQLPDAWIAGDGWWPDINLADLRDVATIDPTVTAPRLREAAVAAMLDVNRQLAAWRLPLELAGSVNLEAVPAAEADGQSVLVHHYARAVFSTVAAGLAERLRNIAATTAGAERAEEMLTIADTHRRDARWAVADLQAKPRSTVELI